ncbi:Thiosulfate sulfurtransferase [Flagellimonas maritima]|uniref:Thiosulfate sulfurtransferase n=2 Tax=Flagellimonas maritima TaxID=1383885 RepID=A0A2Z4LT64_9FLAO|nr:Thiosulfate sulfurtransferase [Allomuricauda aurantiaca]
MKSSSRILVFCSLLLIACQSQQQGTIKKIDKKTIKTDVIGAEVQLIDVRTPEEFQIGHIDKAVNFNIMDSIMFSKQIITLDKNRPVYLYCRRGNRSNKAAGILSDNGFKIVYDYSGGYDDWSIQN